MADAEAPKKRSGPLDGLDGLSTAANSVKTSGPLGSKKDSWFEKMVEASRVPEGGLVS
jgi:hypothetical protein